MGDALYHSNVSKVAYTSANITMNSEHFEQLHQLKSHLTYNIYNYTILNVLLVIHITVVPLPFA